ncbi:DUF6279 family lipoprotein [Polaromonas sp. CT11-55]|uniref:DUF6279 family lipoprotein n=1 Tax=Polaromonas sp. CT11-55 TaxID=3243045 RepID=UPI0039A52766
MKFPLDLGVMTRSRAARAGARRCTRIIGGLAVLALAGLLQSCSLMKIAYNQAPELVYWQLDRHFDFTDAQSLQVKADLDKLQAWHRQTQLPGYIEALQKLQKQMPSDMDAAAACAIYTDVRGKLVLLSRQAEPPMATLVSSLQAGQLKNLERRFAKGNEEYREDFLEASPKAQRDKRYKEAVKRAEMLYGQLDRKQLAVIERRIDTSHFDAPRSYAEKIRRQQDALHTLRPLVAGQATPEKTQAAVRGLFERTLTSPDAAYRDYMEKLTQDACATIAELHNSTTPAQRHKAVETLHRYEQDFRTLHAQKS